MESFVFENETTIVCLVADCDVLNVTILEDDKAPLFIVLAYRLALSLSLSFPFLPQLRISVAAAMLLAAPSAIAFTTPVGSLASPVKSLHARYIVSVYSLYPSRFFAISKWKCCNLSIR